MDYYEIKIVFDKDASPLAAELLPAYLGEIGFESFVDNNFGMSAFIQVQLFKEDELSELLKNFEYCDKITFEKVFVKGQNWNEEWEKNYFQPIIVDERCVIHSSFHKDVPSAKYDILIDPKMSFGTGHHETTFLMLTRILDTNFAGKTVLDMGCGTAVLAILANKLGAKDITAIDIDEWAYDNAKENITLNNADNIEVKIGDASLLGNKKFDIILANINLNVLLADMKKYSECLNPGGKLFMSGFYNENMQAIKDEASMHNLEFVTFNEKNRWVVNEYVKK